MKEAVMKLQIESLEQQLKVLKSKIIAPKKLLKKESSYRICMELMRVKWIFPLKRSKNMNTPLRTRYDLFVFPAIVLAEIKHLISIKRINIDFDMVLEYLSESENCVVYPVDENVVEKMPDSLNIHDALIVGTGLVYKNILKEEVGILTEDEEIATSGILPVI